MNTGKGAPLEALEEVIGAIDEEQEKLLSPEYTKCLHLWNRDEEETDVLVCSRCDQARRFPNGLDREWEIIRPGKPNQALALTRPRPTEVRPLLGKAKHKWIQERKTQIIRYVAEHDFWAATLEFDMSPATLRRNLTKWGFPENYGLVTCLPLDTRQKAESKALARQGVQVDALSPPVAEQVARIEGEGLKARIDYNGKGTLLISDSSEGFSILVTRENR